MATGKRCGRFTAVFGNGQWTDTTLIRVQYDCGKEETMVVPEMDDLEDLRHIVKQAIRALKRKHRK